MKKISVCYVLSYYSPRYVRTEALIKALQKIEEIELHQARNSSKGILRYFETLLKLLIIRFFHNPQYYILGFRGYEIFWIVRLITRGRFLIYDHMMSPYDSLVNEKKSIRRAGVLNRTIYFYEKSILNGAELVLTDTEIHRQYFHLLFGTPLEKIVAIPVGTDEELFRLSSTSNAKSEFFEVLYFGSFLPLHGMDIILKAASKLRDKPINFTLIGGNRIDLSAFQQICEEFGLKNVTHIDWVEFEELPRYIAQADIGLGGPFGNTGQARRVITGKTFQFLAMARPVIVGFSVDNEDGFENRVNCLLVPQGDEQALADAILWAFEHKDKLNEIGRSGYELYSVRYSTLQISKKLTRVFSL